jgi:hypothetical protein
MLTAKANELAARINARWSQNPYHLGALAVSGSYMSRCDPLPELSLWVVLGKRPEMRGQRWGPSLTRDAAVGQIVAALRALSSFVVVHIVADKQDVPRPFSLIFEGDVDAMERPVPAWEKLRDWSASISRRLVSR